MTTHSNLTIPQASVKIYNSIVYTSGVVIVLLLLVIICAYTGVLPKAVLGAAFGFAIVACVVSASVIVFKMGKMTLQMAADKLGIHHNQSNMDLTIQQ